MPIGCGIRELQKQWSLQRQSSARGFFDESIEVRHQFVADFDEMPSNSLLCRATHPRLLIARAFLAVIAIDGLKAGNFNPLRHQIRSGSSGEPTDVRAAHCEAAKPEIFQHGCGHAEMV